MILIKNLFHNMKIKFFFSYILFFSFNVFAFDKNNIIINGDVLIDENVIFSIIDNNLITDSIWADIDSNKILDDIYKTGLFSNVQIDIVNNKLIINLISEPRINTINFSGNKRFKDDDFYEIINNNFRSYLL